jgi:penicillin amidase
MDDVAKIQLDAFNLPVKNFASEVMSLRAASNPTLEVLKDWDGVMRPESRAALFASEIRGCTATKIAADNPGVPAGVILTRVIDYGLMKSKPTLWLPKSYPDYSSLIKACDSEVTASFPTKYGADPAGWTWGALTKSRFPHPLAVAPLIGGQFATPSVPIAGSRETPNVASFVSMRHIASPGNWDATRHVIPLGQSGNPQSPYYKDQFEMWRTGAPAVFPFTKQAVESATQVQWTLRPAQ